MIKKSVSVLASLSYLIAPHAQAQEAFTMAALSPSPAPVLPASILPIDQVRIQGITKTLIAYPSQTPAILQNYVGIDTTKIDFNQFMPIVERGNVAEIEREVTTLYQNRDAFNNGTFTDVSYYNMQTPVTPIDTTVAADPMAPAPQTAPVETADITTDSVIQTDTVATATTTTETQSTSSKIFSAIVDTPAGAKTTGLLLTGGLIAGAAAASVAGSGGGSSGNGGSNGPTSDVFNRASLPDVQQPSDFEDTEFNNYPLGGLNRINAQYAYAKGLTGAGVSIGFYDFFTTDKTTDPELNARIVYRDLNIAADTVALDPYCSPDPTNEAACDHGGVVMDYAAAERNGVDSMGVAYGASLMMNSVYKTVDARPLADQGADIINFSCTGCGDLSDLQYIADQGVLMTSATGNSTSFVDGGANPHPFSPAAYADQLDYQLLAVTGIYSSGGNITSYGYYKCGTQKEFCLSAYSDNGTSFAAPQVAGAAALVKEGWNYLTAKQIGQILLYSAKDIGAAGVDAIYGHGLLDIKAALEPVGSVTALTGGGASSLFAPSVISQNQGSAFGNAFAAPSNAKGNIVVVDSFGRDFAVKTQNNLAIARDDKFSPDMMFALGRKQNNFTTVKMNNGLSFQFKRQQNELQANDMASFAEYEVNPTTKVKLGFSTDMSNIATNDLQEFNTFNFISQDSFKNGYLNFSDNDQVINQALELKTSKNTSVKFSRYYSKNSEADYFKPVDNQVTSDFTASIIDTNYTPRDDLNINVKNGVTHEFDSVLGTKFSGSFEMDNGADTYFTGVDVSYDIAPNWNIFGSYTFGNTQASPSARSAFSNISNLTSDSFSIAATRSDLLGNDSLTMAVGQPTRVRSGTATGLTQSVDPTSGAVSTASFQQSLVPTGRNLQFQAAYQKDVNDAIGFNFALEYETNPYQAADAEPEASGLAKMIYRFN